MAYILNIETSTKNCSVALAKEGEMIVCREIAEMGYSHAEKLHVFIEETLTEANLKFSDLKAIAVSQGPGSYTGLRIGVDTLEVLASQISIEEGVIVPMIDARRMEVYSAIFDKNHQKIRDIKAEILNEESFSDMNETIYFVGDSSQKAKTLLQKDNFVFVDDVIYPSAKQMTKKSYTLFANNRFEDVAYFEPFYLKDFMTS